jgi:sulfate-transporting ATPase
MWLWQSQTRVGTATRAAAQNERAVATLGWSPNQLATVSWVAGGGLAGLAGALVAPITGLTVSTLVLLVVPALAAALLGRFDSFWLTLLGATAIGVAQSLIIRYVTQPGAADALPFLVIVVVLAVTGRALPIRSHLTERLPSLGSGIVRPIPAALSTLGMIVLMLWVFNIEWQNAFTISLSVAVILLSIVVLTGYAGQVSLCQYALAGLGCYVTARLVATTSTPFWAAALIGIAAAVPIGAIFALPALRTRGVNLAVITLGLGVAVQGVLFSNVEYTGGLGGTNVGNTHLFNLDINQITHADRWGVFVIIVFALAALAVATLRRSAAGRRLIAIRENERAAASLGISVVGAKTYAFMVAAALAAIGGILIGFRTPSVTFTSFDPFQSIYATAYAVIGGLGFVMGPVAGSTLASGGIGTLFNGIISGIDDYLVLIGGVVVILMVVTNPDGLVPKQIQDTRRIAAALQRRWGLKRRDKPARAAPVVHVAAPTQVPPRTLAIRDLTVRFGGVVAVREASIDVRPGEVVGLIGPNGAGKTTVIDAITGFVRGSGTIQLDGQEISRRSPSRRVNGGIARSWQSLELFEDISVFENLQIASESATHSWRRYLHALVWPGRSSLTPAATAAVAEFELQSDLERRPGDLPYGRRRLVGIGRAVALNPSVLLLDEPAAGLSTAESAELGRLVRRLAETWGMAVLLVEHDVGLVMSVCDRIYVLNFGNVIAHGTPDEIRADPAVVTAYLGEDEAAPRRPDEMEPAAASGPAAE